MLKRFQSAKERYKRQSYAQCGEDAIVDFVMGSMLIDQPSYLDIGAHHPYHLSNTALFYEKGCTGVCVEPDPQLFKAIKKVRKHDLCLNVGVSTGTDVEADFYMMSEPSLNTFSSEQANEYATVKGLDILDVIKLPLISINELIANRMGYVPNFISLDIEGLDYAVLASFDFQQYRPEVFCVETLTYTQDNTEKKIESIKELMLDRGYMVYADTYINTIFVERECWANRKKS